MQPGARELGVIISDRNAPEGRRQTYWFVSPPGAGDRIFVHQSDVDRLKTFLETNLPPVSSKKKKKGPAFSLGVVEPDLGKAIAEATGAHCRSDDVVRELLRGARQHLTKFVPELQNNLLEQAQVGLGHAFSRCKVNAPS